MGARPKPTVAAPALRTFAHRLSDGAATTVHVAAYPLEDWSPRVAVLSPPTGLEAWCAASGESEALVGGFFIRPHGAPLGELWTGGRRRRSVGFQRPDGPGRACVALDGGRARIAPRRRLPGAPRGDLLQAGPLLVEGGRSIVRDGGDPEGFSSGARQFDSDITVGRYPRAALGVRGRSLVAVVCDGRSDRDAGMTLAELAALMARVRCEQALNLDGGGSTSLVSGGRLVNRPREEHGIELVAGRPVSTAIVFSRR